MITRFTAYRRNLAERGTHTEAQRNPDDQPQYEGVVFSDGTCVLKWLTKANSVSVFATLEQMLSVHGHPEYGTEIIWHDGTTPPEWEHQLIAHAEHEQNCLKAKGLDNVTLVTEHAKDTGELTSIVLKTPRGAFHKQIFPVPHE